MGSRNWVVPSHPWVLLLVLGSGQVSPATVSLKTEECAGGWRRVGGHVIKALLVLGDKTNGTHDSTAAIGLSPPFSGY